MIHQVYSGIQPCTTVAHWGKPKQLVRIYSIWWNAKKWYDCNGGGREVRGTETSIRTSILLTTPSGVVCKPVHSQIYRFRHNDGLINSVKTPETFVFLYGEQLPYWYITLSSLTMLSRRHEPRAATQTTDCDMYVYNYITLPAVVQLSISRRECIAGAGHAWHNSPFYIAYIITSHVRWSIGLTPSPTSYVLRLWRCRWWLIVTASYQWKITATQGCFIGFWWSDSL